MLEGKQEVIVGAGLFTSPLWIQIVHAISDVASFIAIVTGALIGLHGCWRIVQRWRNAR